MSSVNILRFQSQLGDYYEDLAAWLSQVKDTKILEVFEADAQRYAGTPRGELAQDWAARYQENGADLAQTWAGCMPEDDLAVLRAQRVEGGDKTLTIALRDLARTHRLRAQVRSAALATVGVGVFALMLTAVSATLLPIYAVDVLQDAMRVSSDNWGPWGQRLAAWAELVTAWGLLALGILASLIALVVYSLPHWTGDHRDWADQHILIYRVYHQINAMRVAMTMATLTRKSASTILTLRRSIELLHASTQAPYQAWQLQRLLDRIDSGNAQGAAVFDTGIFSREMCWRLQDLSRGMNLSESFSKLVDVVESIWLRRLLRLMTFWRWVLLLASVAAMALIVVSIQVSATEMKQAIMDSIQVS
jgi:type II secretory pathway component PulF